MPRHLTRPLEVGESIGGYKIVGEIGYGGFGIVYEAVNPVTQDRAAIKQFMPRSLGSWRQGTMVIEDNDSWEVHQKILKRFEDEATLQFKFDHPNILKVKNFIRDGDTGYMIAEYIDGTTLVDFLAKCGKAFADEDMFRRLMEPITEAIAYVHERLALHRDISPDNILIDKSQRPVLVDFGAAKLDLRRNPTKSSLVPYREFYAPIEQRQPAAERPEGYYTDIFALAGTMYHTLSGVPPKAPMERALASKDTYVPLAQVAKTKCSERVYRAIDNGLALAPITRPQTIQNFVDLLGWRRLSPPPPPPLPPDSQPASPVPDAESPRPPNRVLGYLTVVILILVVIGGLYLLNRSPLPPTPSPPISRQPPTPPPPNNSPLPNGEPPKTVRSTYTTYENRDIDGGDLPGLLPHFLGVDRSACETECNKDSRCVGYSYDKWNEACYLKGSLPDLRFEPQSTSVIRTDKGPEVPDYLGARKLVSVKRTFVGKRYATSSTDSRQTCSDFCQREDSCLGYQYAVGGLCWLYNQIDSVIKDDTAQAGVKRQIPP